MRTQFNSKIFFFFSFVALFAFATTASGQSAPKPKFSYLNDFSFKDSSVVKLSGPGRVVDFEGRKGLNLTSIRSVLEMKQHNMKETKGTVTLWVMSLEELATSLGYPGMSLHNPNWKMYPILADSPNPQDFEKANFKMVWYNGWHPNLIALFGKGKLYEEAFFMPHKALVSVSHFIVKKKVWYQFALSWDYEKNQYRMYVNGVHVGSEDQYKDHLPQRSPMNSSLYIGNPTLCYSNINFYEEVFSEKQVYNLFKNEATRFNKTVEDDLLSTYAGKNIKPFKWKINDEWNPKLMLSLTKSSDLDSLYVQGKPVDVQITPEGLLLETINKEMTSTLLESQMYIWTKKPFEGDLYVEYEYKTLRPGGLSLLLTQASGMNREDFMADYPLRTSGRMTMIYGEDVRNYHWEYFREQPDMKNDLDNSAFMKQPYNYPMAFKTGKTAISKDTWHKLQFLQQGNKITGAIDGKIMFEVYDNPLINNGPVLDFGRVAIRLMLRSKMMFRNLKIYNKGAVEVEQIFNKN